MIALLLISLLAQAEYQVFGVKSDFALNADALPQRDVYVNIGTSQGIKQGSTLEVYRSVTTVDQINQRTGRNIQFKIAKLKVIHAEADVAVARLQEFMPASQTPNGVYTNVMVGDRVEVGKK